MRCNSRPASGNQSRIRARLIAPGSHVAISCLRFDDPTVWAQITEAYSVSRLHNFTREPFGALFGALDFEPPGIVPAVHLRAGWQQVPETPPGPKYMIGAIGRGCPHLAVTHRRRGYL